MNYFVTSDHPCLGRNYYCFRMIKSNGIVLDAYNNYPKLTTSDKGGWIQTTDSDFNNGVKSNTSVSGGNVKLAIDTSSIDKGDGSDGALTVTTADTIINDYAYITDATVSSGTNTFNVNDASNFSPGDEILIIQIQHDATDSNAGTYEFKDISSISGNQITVSSNLTHTYYSNDFNNETASAAQIVRVPQYTDVTVNSGASIVAPDWDGYKGGIVVFRATGTVTVNGTIDVSEKGYRGGFSGVASNCDGAQGESYKGKDTSNTCYGYGAKKLGKEGGGGVTIHKDIPGKTDTCSRPCRQEPPRKISRLILFSQSTSFSCPPTFTTSTPASEKNSSAISSGYACLKTTRMICALMIIFAQSTHGWWVQ